MLRLQCQYPVQRLPPRFRSLPRQCRHQIDVDIGKACLPRRRISLTKGIKAVNPSEQTELTVICRLQPKADPVDPKAAIRDKL